MEGTVYLKLGIVFLVIVFIVHIVGCATPSWATIDIPGNLGSFQTGLWQLCFDQTIFGRRIHGCDGRKLSEEGWFRAAQILETFGAIGLLISGIISLVMLCSHREKALRVINIFVIICSGLFIIIGIIVFGTEFRNAFDGQISTLHKLIEVDDKLGYSFVLSAVGGGLCLLVCVPLFVVDYRSLPPTQSTRNVPVQYTDQRQVIIPSKGPAQAHYQSRGSMPQYDHRGEPVQYVVQHQAYHHQPQHGVHHHQGSRKMHYSSRQYR